MKFIKAIALGATLCALFFPSYAQVYTDEVQVVEGLGGNMGIGIIPESRLDVLFTDSSVGNRRIRTYGGTGLRFQRSGDTGGWSMLYGFLSNDASNDWGGFGAWGSGNATLHYYFIGNDYSTPVAVFKLDGTVGIGTSTPLSPLHIFQAGPSALRLERANHDTYDIKLAGSKGLYITNASDSRHELVFAGDGRIGIGTENPTAVLDIAGVHSSSGGFNLSHPHNRHANGIDNGLSVAGTEIQSINFYYTGASPNAVIGKVSAVNYNTDGTGWYEFANRYDAGLSFYTSNGGTLIERVTIAHSGNVGIGTASPSQKLHVAGNVRATSFISSTQTYADFVFEDGYKLRPLSEVEAYIKENKHLPEIPTEAEVMENGMDLTAMNVKLLQKVEELTLYLIEQNKSLQLLQKENESQQREIEKLKTKMR